MTESVFKPRRTFSEVWMETALKLCANALVGCSANLEEKQPIGGGATMECAFEKCIRTLVSPLSLSGHYETKNSILPCPPQPHLVTLSQCRLRNNGAKRL